MRDEFAPAALRSVGVLDVRFKYACGLLLSRALLERLLPYLASKPSEISEPQEGLGDSPRGNRTPRAKGACPGDRNAKAGERSAQGQPMEERWNRL
jgi:hypothetical protein